ncbi:MAG TPA: helix-turn-helix domain-containing protein [Candidatus Olsenella pullistercoris]|uniref:Helix-turn-helix domain-containing protein n=1 Tax=Candidatus Olsenella pullistercoris TaxID=2838712 RepID=A0A9D2EZU0_9ACTN|nr:helix-turn-helix domain-containing protein [Candidatus Olsenella pullistercoris]
MEIGQPSAPHAIGARIRARREAMGLSQAELARRVYVSRQTVGNWEAGRTLADVQSLVLLASVFGVSVDELVGEGVARVARPSAEDRHELVQLLAGAGMLLGAALLLVFAAHLVSLLGPGDVATNALRAALDVAALACAGALFLRALPSLRAFTQGRGLADAVAVAAYLEGRDASEPPPSDFLFRWLIPYWKLWLVALVAAAFAAVGLLVA